MLQTALYFAVIIIINAVIGIIFLHFNRFTLYLNKNSLKPNSFSLHLKNIFAVFVVFFYSVIGIF